MNPWWTILHSILVLYLPNVLSFNIRPVIKVDKSKFDPDTHYYHFHNDGTPYETPVLIENALSIQECDSICNGLLHEVGKEVVDLQHKFVDEEQKDETRKVQTEIIKCHLEDAFSYMMESEHGDSFFCFSEGILDEYEHLNPRYAKECLFQGCDVSSLDSDVFKRDVFDFFPHGVKPTDCLVVSGMGSSSTLHRDPFLWTGTSICLEGTKVWRFIAPPGALSMSNTKDDVMEESGISCVDKLLDAYRLESAAWGDYNLSSGWQSNFSLYDVRDESVPSAEKFSFMEEEDNAQKLKWIERIASSLQKLQPSSDMPQTYPGGEEVTIFSVIQKPGDLLVIPAYWWHQTYALEPSIAIASQRGGLNRDAERIFHHVLETTRQSCKKLPGYFQNQNMNDVTPKDIVDDLFALL
jgi:hypothetical protein